MILGAGQACVWVCTYARACRNGRSPVYMASCEGHSDCVAALVRAGAPPLEQQLSYDEEEEEEKEEEEEEEEEEEAEAEEEEEED